MPHFLLTLKIDILIFEFQDSEVRENGVAYRNSMHGRVGHIGTESKKARSVTMLRER